MMRGKVTLPWTEDLQMEKQKPPQKKHNVGFYFNFSRESEL